MLVQGLRRSRSPRAELVAVEALGDADLRGYAAVVLRTIGTQRALPALAAVVEQGPDWPRRQAERAVRDIKRRRGSAPPSA